MNKEVTNTTYKKTEKKTVVFNWSETRAVAEMDMKSLIISERNILRMVYGPVVEQEIWRIRTNQDLWERCKNWDMVLFKETVGNESVCSKNGSQKVT